LSIVKGPSLRIAVESPAIGHNPKNRVTEGWRLSDRNITDSTFQEFHSGFVMPDSGAAMSDLTGGTNALGTIDKSIPRSNCFKGAAEAIRHRSRSV
jgi:hypothetical protein